MCLKYAPAKPPSSMSKTLPIMPRFSLKHETPRFPRALRSPRISSFVAFCSLFGRGPDLSLAANVIYCSVIITRRCTGDDRVPSKGIYTVCMTSIEPPWKTFTRKKGPVVNSYPKDFRFQTFYCPTLFTKIITSTVFTEIIIPRYPRSLISPGGRYSCPIYDQNFDFQYPIDTLGARGFSCAVSGVGYVSIVTRAKTTKLVLVVFSPLVSSAEQREKNLWCPGYPIDDLTLN